MPDAYEAGLRLLSRRALTRREVAARLRARGHDDAEIDAAIRRLSEIGAIDDVALARQWVASRAESRGRGRDRALAELIARGVDEEVAASAWSRALADGTIDEDAALARAVRLRLGAVAAPAEKGRLARVYNALLFEGFDHERIEAALAPYGFERTEE